MRHYEAVYIRAHSWATLGPGKGGTPLYKPYRYVPPGMDFPHFGLELSIVFEGATVVYEHICQWFQMNKR